MTIKEQITQLLAGLNQGLVERESIVNLALLSALAGESIFMLGPPGVAKSLVARRLKYSFAEGKRFEYLMNRFSTPDEIFGPVSIKKLKDEGEYERMTDDYLPGATVVFLDEIWKAGPSIQNSLLTVLNEKIYRNGAHEIQVPLRALISASNELPMKGEGLEALWDRFLVRLSIEGIQTRKNFDAMVTSGLDPLVDNIPDKIKLSPKTLDEIKAGAQKIQVPKNVLGVIHVIRAKVQEHNQNKKKEEQLYVSDRRWRKIVNLLRTAAFLNGRTEVDLMDCFLIPHCTWNEPNQLSRLEKFTTEAIEKFGYQVDLDLETIEEAIKDWDKDVKGETSFSKPVSKSRLKEYNDEYYKIEGKDEFVKIVDFNSLSHDFEYKYASVKSGKGFAQGKRYEMKKGSTSASILLREDRYYNSQGNSYS